MNKKIIKNKGDYIARIQYNDEKSRYREELVSEHLLNTAIIAENNCPVKELKNIAIVTALLHDAGKLSDDFQSYMMNVKKDANYRELVDHTSGGGVLIHTYMKQIVSNYIEKNGTNLPKQSVNYLKSLIKMSKLIEIAIYSHHGTKDSFYSENGNIVSLVHTRRDKTAHQIDIIYDRFFEIIDANIFSEYIDKAIDEWNKLQETIEQYTLKYYDETPNSQTIADTNFSYGLLERLLISILFDSDWSAAAGFICDLKYMDRENVNIWNDLHTYFENYIRNKSYNAQDKEINEVRNKISTLCMEKANNGTKGCVRFTSDTGTGKTLSGLRFALTDVFKSNKKHIFYIAPTTTILTQNAKEIREAVGVDNAVLEHHYNVILDDDTNIAEYNKLIGTWNSPIIVTSAVQFLDTEIKSKKTNIRRFKELANSVIIVDEVQDIPDHCLCVFNQLVNFLTHICHTKVVLSSATQPSLYTFNYHNIIDYEEMFLKDDKIKKTLDRVNYIYEPNVLSLEDLSKYVVDKIEQVNSLLVVLNTKPAARNLFLELQKNTKLEENTIIVHLSKHMTYGHIDEEIEDLKKLLQEQQGHKISKKIICISTSLIESGVDISFDAAIRSMTGFDRIVQTAGRCNRNGNAKHKANIYIVQLNESLENIRYIDGLQRKQSSTKIAIYMDSINTDSETNITSPSSIIKKYYKNYYESLSADQTIMDMTGTCEGPSAIRTALSTNTKYEEYFENKSAGSSQNISSSVRLAEQIIDKVQSQFLNQNFKSAGETFEVIKSVHLLPVLVDYDHTNQISKLLEDLQEESSRTKRQLIINKLNKYTVEIPYSNKDKTTAYHDKSGNIIAYILNPQFYNDDCGFIG